MSGQDDDYTGLGLNHYSEMRAQFLITVVYRIPLLVLLGLSFGWAPPWACLLLFVGAFTMLSDFFDEFGYLLRIGAFVGAHLLGAPLWLVVTVAGVSTAWRASVKSVSYLVARWLPVRPSAQVWEANCPHLTGTGRSTRSLIELGRGADALDASLQALAQHPREAEDCLAELALMIAEIAVVGDAPDTALESADAALRLTRDTSEAHRAIRVRAHLAGARARALQGKYELARSAVDRAARETNGNAKLDKPVRATADGISAVTNRSSLDPDKLIPKLARTLGIRGDAIDVMLLDCADWYRISGHARESLDLYHLARGATEFDRFIGELDKIPRVIGRRWSLRGRRWARAVTGQLQARLAVGDRPSDALMKAAGAATTVLENLGERPALVQLLGFISEAHARNGEADGAISASQAAGSTSTRHLYVVSDWSARSRWEDAVKLARKAASTVRSGGPPLADERLAADATWLAGDGVNVSRAGVELARAVDDLLVDRYITALRAVSMRLGAVGRKEEALEAADEVVRFRRQADGANHNPIWYLGFPLWRLGICHEEAGRDADGLDAHLESLPYFRQGAAQDDSARRTCALAVRDCVARLVSAKRYEEALPLALETVRRLTELTTPEEPTEDTHLANEKLARIYDSLERYPDCAETAMKLARIWEGSTREPIIAHASAAESYWRASRAWRYAERFDDEVDALKRSYEHMSAVDDPEYSRDWQDRRRQTISQRLAECVERAEPESSERVIELRREALASALKIGRDADGDWISVVDASAYPLAISYLRAHRPAEALAAVDEGLTAIPAGHPQTLWLRYTGYLAAWTLGDITRAEADLRESVRLADSDSDADPTWVAVFTRCVIFIAVGDEARADEYIRAATSDGKVLDGEERAQLWGDLTDLERAIGPRPAIDRIRAMLPLDTASTAG